MPEVGAGVRCNGKHYTLPGCSVGRYFVDALSAEISCFALGQYSASCCLVYSSVVLQRDRMIRKGINIHRLLEKRLKMLQEEKFGLMIQGNVHCGHFFIQLIIGYRNLKTVLLSYFLSLYWRVMINLLSVRSLSMLVKVLWTLMLWLQLARTIPFL